MHLLMQAGAHEGLTVLFIYLWVGVYSFGDTSVFLPMALAPIQQVGYACLLRV